MRARQRNSRIRKFYRVAGFRKARPSFSSYVLCGNDCPVQLSCGKNNCGPRRLLPGFRVAIGIVLCGGAHQCMIEAEHNRNSPTMWTVQFHDAVRRDFPGCQVSSATLRTRIPRPPRMTLRPCRKRSSWSRNSGRSVAMPPTRLSSPRRPRTGRLKS